MGILFKSILALISIMMILASVFMQGALVYGIARYMDRVGVNALIPVGVSLTLAIPGIVGMWALFKLAQIPIPKTMI